MLWGEIPPNPTIWGQNLWSLSAMILVLVILGMGVAALYPVLEMLSNNGLMNTYLYG